MLGSWRNKTFRDILFRHLIPPLHLSAYLVEDTAVSSAEMLTSLSCSYYYTLILNSTTILWGALLSQAPVLQSWPPELYHSPKASPVVWRCFFRRQDTNYPTSDSFWEAPGTTGDGCHLHSEGHGILKHIPIGRCAHFYQHSQ